MTTSTTPNTRKLGTDITVLRVVEESSDAVSIVFDVNPDKNPEFAYKPGQFLTLRVPSDQTGFVARCYSLASSPDTDDHLKVTVKRTRDGYASNWLCDNVRAGLDIHTLPPSGHFTPVDSSRDLLLFAAGSGITPVISILKSALQRSDRHIALFYANRDRSSVIFHDELTELARRHPHRVSITEWLESERGIPTLPELHSYAGQHGAVERDAFICGPGPFMTIAERALGELGVDHSQINVEKFNSLTGDPFTLEIKEAIPSDDDAVVTVELDGEQHTLPWPAESTLVDMLIAAGIDAPYSCREGECGSCACLLTEGTVNRGNVSALEPEDVDDGYILGCQATPTSKTLAVEF